MAQISGASYEKAFFTNKDTQSVFYVQYNPKEFKLDEKALWKPSEVVETDKPLLLYERGDPTLVTMELIFDSTDSDDNVYDKYVGPLRDFLTSDVETSDEVGSELKRPPHCVFTWGSFSFECVVDNVSATFLMFKADGTPLRARVTVGLKENKREVTSAGSGKVTLSAMGSIFNGAAAAASVYTTGPGDTLSTVAAMTGADPKHIAIANDILDPLELEAGAELVIPANGELAAILGEQLRRDAPGDWKADSVGGNVGAFSFEGGSDGSASGAVDLGDAFVSFDTDGGS